LILLTGGTGYIGSHIAIALHASGRKFVLFDNFFNSSPRITEPLTKILGLEPQIVEGDIRDRSLLEQVLQQYSIDWVIHCAGLKAVGESVTEPLRYFENNVVGTIRLLEAMTSCGVKKMVFSSSATVYGDPIELPIPESHRVLPTNPYGATKAQIEVILESICRAQPDWSVANLRYFNPVGAHHSGLIGENPRGVPNNLMPYVARVATGQLKELNVFGNDYDTPDGTGVRDYIHIMDLAEGHVAAMEAATRGFHTFNLGTGQGYSVLQMVAAFEKASGQEIPRRFVARRDGDIASCFADPSKAKQALEWVAKRGLAEMCESTWRYQSLANGIR
jgi:UDP-glucose 4-epimerase